MKTIIFHIMSTFRWLIVTSSKILSALMIFVLIFSLFNDTSNQTANLIITFIVAVLSGAFSWYYDVLLKKLEP
ncbi:MAG: hypothetical protein ACJAZP_001310 [Psychromonas sp.]|jgi:hypothetical protein